MTWRDDPPGDTDECGVGYQKPPRASRFAKGRSGNPAGRPRGRHQEPPYEAVLGQMVTIREDGIERRVTAADAFMLQLMKRGLEGDGTAARTCLAAIEEAKERHGVGPRTITGFILVGMGSLSLALELLRMATKLDPYRDTARLALESWLVAAALARLDRKFSPAEQRTIVNATRTPRKVRWPGWWIECP
jgi:hypothetical protein